MIIITICAMMKISKINIDRKNSCNELFEDKDYLLHTASIVPYTVFINNKNYTYSIKK